MRQCNTCPLKETGFSFLFAKNLTAKKIGPSKIPDSINHDAADAAKQQANGSKKCVSRE